MSFVASALAVSVVSGLYGAYSANQSGKAQAAAMSAQAESQQLQQAEQARIDSARETEEVLAKRKQQARRRASIEASYANAGVVLEGSAEDILTRQREVDELNIQRTHYTGNTQRRFDKWASDNNVANMKYSAGAARRNASRSLVSGIMGAGSTVLDSGTYTKNNGWVWKT